MPTDKRLRTADARDLGDPTVGDTVRSEEPGGAAAGILGPDEPAEVALGFSSEAAPSGVNATTGTNAGEVDVDVSNLGEFGAVDLFVFADDGVTELARAEAIIESELPYTFEDLEPNAHVEVRARGTDGLNTTEFSGHDNATVQD